MYHLKICYQLLQAGFEALEGPRRGVLHERRIIPGTEPTIDCVISRIPMESVEGRNMGESPDTAPEINGSKFHKVRVIYQEVPPEEVRTNQVNIIQLKIRLDIQHNAHLQSGTGDHSTQERNTFSNGDETYDHSQDNRKNIDHLVKDTGHHTGINDTGKRRDTRESSFRRANASNVCSI